MCLRFSIGEKTEEKLKRAKEILSEKAGFTDSIEDIFDRALDALLEKEDPKRRQQRREKRGFL